MRTCSPDSAQVPITGITAFFGPHQRQRRPRRDAQRDQVHRLRTPGRPEHVSRKEQRQIHDHADHREDDSGQRRSEGQLAVGGLDQRVTREDEDVRRLEGEPVHQRGRQRGGRERQVRPKQCVAVTTNESHKSHHDQRSRLGLAQRQTDHIICVALSQPSCTTSLW